MNTTISSITSEITFRFGIDYTKVAKRFCRSLPKYTTAVVVAGSHSFGLGDDTSDLDVHIIFLAPVNTYLGLGIEGRSAGGSHTINADGKSIEIKYYELKEWFWLMITGFHYTLPDLEVLSLFGDKFWMQLMFQKRLFYSKNNIYNGISRFIEDAKFRNATKNFPEKPLTRKGLVHRIIAAHVGQSLLLRGEVNVAHLINENTLKNRRTIPLNLLQEVLNQEYYNLNKAYQKSKLPDELNISVLEKILVDKLKEHCCHE